MPKFYAVKSGRGGPQIYLNWPSCDVQVKGYPNAVFKSFTTMSAAKDYLKGGNPIGANESHTPHNHKQTLTITIVQSDEEILQGTLKMISMIPVKDIVCYTDGACSGNPGPAGSGVYIQWPNRLYTTQNSKFLGHGTNNIAEMYAFKLCLETIISTVKAIQDGYIANISVLGAEVYILTDSKYCIGILRDGNNVNANLELVNEVKNLISICGFVVRIGWVPAHTGHPGLSGNDKADQLATGCLIK
jgi:ribonuclease HI